MKRVNLVIPHILKTTKSIVIISVIASLSYCVTTSAKQDEMDKYIAEYKKFQAQADSAIHFADSLKTQITIEENEARAAESRAKALGSQVVELRTSTTNLKTVAATMSKTITDTLELARAILPVKDSIIAQQEITIETQASQVSELERALKNKDNAILLLTTSRDSLQKVVINIPQAPKNPNRMFGIKLPSRKMSFLVGIGVGVVSGVLVVK